MSTISEVIFMHKKTGEIYLGFSVHFSMVFIVDRYAGPILNYVCDPYLRPLGLKELIKDWEFIGYV